MEYKVEELSPVKRKVAVEVSVEEVHAALAATVALPSRSRRNTLTCWPRASRS